VATRTGTARAALALAQAELKSAEASLRQSQQLLTRYERLINLSHILPVLEVALNNHPFGARANVDGADCLDPSGESAEASLRQSQQLLTRYERLINNHSISRNDVDTARRWMG
jgi:multidrug resistance efflux pump